MENAIYEISTAKNDFETGTVDAEGSFVIPSFKCSSCKLDAWVPPVWYASLQSTAGGAIESMASVPEQLSGLDEYVALLSRLRVQLNTDKQLRPGSIVGANPISVPRKGSAGELTVRKFQKGIDFIWASMFNLIVSPRVFEILMEGGFNPPNGPVEINVEGKKIEGYRVLEIEPCSAWHQDEKEKYGISECPACGVVWKKSWRGTFAQKKFEASIFKNAPAIVRSNEDNSLYMNQGLYERLEKAKLTGASFKAAGSY